MDLVTGGILRFRGRDACRDAGGRDGWGMKVLGLDEANLFPRCPRAAAGSEPAGERHRGAVAASMSSLLRQTVASQGCSARRRPGGR